MALSKHLWRPIRACGDWLARALRAALTQPASLTLTGLGCLMLVISNGPPAWPHAPFVVFAVGGSVALLGAFGGFLLATRNEYPRWLVRTLRWLALPIMLWAVVMAVQSSVLLANGLATTATQRPPQYTSDAMYYMQYSAVLVVHGENPYTGPRLAEALVYYHTHAYTPVERGRFSDPRHVPTSGELNAIISEYLAHPDHPPVEVDPRTFASYPAGAFLVAVPTELLGLPSIGFLQLLLFLALGVSVIARAPAGSRFILALFLLSNPAAVSRITNGDFDIWWVAFLIWAWMLHERRWAAGLLLGAACAIKQTAWFAAPFYLLWVWRCRGAAEAARQGTTAVGAFIAINLPWIVWSLRPWLTSLLLPMSLPLEPGGRGLIELSLSGALPLFPSAVYSALELALWVGALVWAALKSAVYPYAGLVLPLLLLVVSWRSPERYFLLLSVLGVAATALTLRQGAPMGNPNPAEDGAIAERTAPRLRLPAVPGSLRGVSTKITRNTAFVAALTLRPVLRTASSQTRWRDHRKPIHEHVYPRRNADGTQGASRQEGTLPQLNSASARQDISFSRIDGAYHYRWPPCSLQRLRSCAND